MRTLAIGDIHGCLTALTTVLCAADVTPKDSLVFLGDYIDRGFESRAVVAPDLDMADQPESVLLWERHTDRIRHKSGKMVVCGHTPQRSGAPSRTADSVCIDTGACHGGWLTCLDVDSTEYWQAREDGSTRQARL